MVMNETVVPNYPFSFSFERECDPKLVMLWYKHNWTQSIYWITFYVIVIFGGRKWMSTRERYSLRKPLLVWNSFLAIFSIFGTLRTLPELYLTVTTFGFYHSVCSNSYTNISVNSFWLNLFGLSKVVEFGDTFYIILRKQRLIFLHWYHHITVLMFTWYCGADLASTIHWYSVMNYLVHSVMYTYYALKAMEVRVPKSIAMVITSGQILQMVMGAFVSLYAMVTKINGHFCAISDSTVYSGVVMYLSYFVLFAIFFNECYLKSEIKTKKIK